MLCRYRRHGIRQSSLYYYFSSKEGALELVCLKGVAGFLETAKVIAGTPGSAGEKLGRLIEAHFVPFRDRGDFVQAASNYEELAKLGATDNEKGRVMLAEARCLAKAGQTQKAVAVYQAVARLPVVDSDILNTAGVGMGELSAGTTTP